eukprot:TRINITY_DN42453_c0_g1_i1.p1 TRINITY_DN42453_c0_g1~~TRINITY_DN42453_c0_g1_i1.p1  ORF type:complete len:201 (-),score=25.22 TRINITY_DN42453_c0_g1_i1:71-673(-)
MPWMRASLRIVYIFCIVTTVGAAATAPSDAAAFRIGAVVASEANLSLATSSPRRSLQETYAFIMDNLKCRTCCEKEYRACECIMNCDLLKGRCDGISKPICDQLRECYTRVDDEDAKVYDFGWQCDLLKCIAFCFRQEDMCSPVANKFQHQHCERALETDLKDCNVDCARAPGRLPACFWGLVVAVAAMAAARGLSAAPA